MPGFRPLIERLTDVYHELTHKLGALIVESLGEDPAEFRRYFDFDEPYLAASLNHNYSLDVFSEEAKQGVRDSYAKFDAKNVGAHIDGPPFVALLINDRPGLQVVAGEGNWVNAPVTCRTAPGDYDVPVIPGSVIVNTGGTLMHLSEGRYSATLHRVNTLLIPEGETRVSIRRCLKWKAIWCPLGKKPRRRKVLRDMKLVATEAQTPVLIAWAKVTRRWWVEEFKALSEQQRREVEAETQAAFELAAERGKRYQDRKATEK